MLTRSAARNRPVGVVQTALPGLATSSKHSIQEASRSKGDSSASSSDESAEPSNVDDSRKATTDSNSTSVSDKEKKSTQETIDRINTRYDSEDEEMEIEIERSVVKDINKRMAKEEEEEQARIEDAEFEEEYERQHELQWDEAVEEQYSVEFQYLCETWDEDDEDEEFYLSAEFDDALQKRIDDWACDWSPDLDKMWT